MRSSRRCGSRPRRPRRPITLRPFPGAALRKAVEGKKDIVVVESALGQMKQFITEELYGCTVPITDYFKPGKGVSSAELVEKVKSMAK